MTVADSCALVSLADIEAAARTLAPVIIRTPLLPVDGLSEQLGVPVWVKPEMLQRTGAFKLRGAYNFIAHLTAEVRARGVVAPSSGNHAQAVALAARLFGIRATVVMPTTAQRAKRTGAERLGARVVLAGAITADCVMKAQEIVRTEGGTLVPPYDDPLIIAGQGTAGLEIVDDLPDVAAVLVPVGGGGLSAGVATAVKLRAPTARVIAVEPAGIPKLSRARAAGHPVRIASTGSLADALLAVEIGRTPFAHHQQYVDEVVSVDDAGIVAGVRFLLDRMKLVAEPTGAVTIAALLNGAVKPTGPTVALLSGGNIEWDGLVDLIAGD